MYDIEVKRTAFLKLEEEKKNEKKNKQKISFKSSSQIEKEKSDSKWTRTKVFLMNSKVANNQQY